jgi:tRNA1Val (adenine37-N6)-methyltransferase
MPTLRGPLPHDELELRRAALAERLGGAVTLDRLAGDFVIFQRRRGHRHSTDDLLTAWYAVTHAPTPAPARLLDLGSGIGSVGLAVLWRFPEATLTAIEVQPASHGLLEANIEANGVAHRARAILGDLRDPATLAAPDGSVSVPAPVPVPVPVPVSVSVSVSVSAPVPFDLVTGSPPYFPPGTGIVSADGQRAAARFELHGDVRDYCRAARTALADGGRFVFCFPTVQRARAEAACASAGLRVIASRDVVPRHGLPALFSLFACEAGAGMLPAPEAPLVVRTADGAHTAELAAVRRSMGLA